MEGINGRIGVAYMNQKTLWVESVFERIVDVVLSMELLDCLTGAVSAFSSSEVHWVNLDPDSRGTQKPQFRHEFI
jgi:hypothetical protein